MSLYSRLDRIAADVEKLNRQVNSVANAPQSQRTSVEGGSIDFNDADGNLKAIVGMQDDGGYTTNVVSGPTPPTPANFTVEVDYGKLVIHWDGEFEDNAVAPTDWDHWSAYAQAGQFVVADRSTDRGGNKSASGGEVTVGVERGPWTVTLLSWSQAGKPSAMATPVTVDVPGYGDLVQETLDEAQELIDEAKAALEAGQADLAGKITDAESALASLQSTLDDLDSTTLPALRNDLDAAEGRLDSAEGQITDAFGQLDAVPGQISDAQQAAIDAAAADAQAKANAARSAAEAAAAQDALSKANAARDAAIASASSDAQAKADAARQAAETAAKADAKAKADAAQAAAIAAAANDATQKANAAQSAAEAKAQAAQVAADAAMSEAESKASVDYILSRGTDLVTNGTGYLNDNTNFSGFVFDPADAPTGARGSFDKDGTATIETDELMPVDSSRRYLMRLQARQTNPNAAGATFLAGVRPYDGDGLPISPTQYRYDPASMVRLAQDLKKGDTVAVVEPGSNWSNSAYTGFSVWNYVDQAGKKWKAGTYTRNIISGANPTLSGNRVTLSRAWAYDTVPAGTYVSSNAGGSSYMYVAAGTTVMPQEWTTFSGSTLKGVHDGTTGPATRQFPPGTAGIRLIFLMSYNGIPVGQVSKQSIAAVSFSDATLALEEAEVAQAASAAAQATADAAQAAAGSAQDAADAAMTAANGLAKVLHGTTVATGTAPNGSIWWQHQGTLSGPVIGQWNRVNGSWVSTPISSEAIANLDVGKLTAGAAELATVVSQKIAAAVGQFLELDVGQLTVTGASKLASVVAEQIAADVGEYVKLSVGQLVAGEGVMDEATVQKLFTDVVVAGISQAEEFIGENAILTGAVTAPKITASEELWAKLGQFVKIRAEHIQSDAFDFMVARGGTYLTSGGNGSWSDNGLFISGPDGTSLVRFPTDGTPLSLTASDVQIDRASIDELDINQQTVRSGGTVTLASGVTAPASPPESTAAWKRDVVLDKPDPGLAYDWTGLAKWGDKWVRGVNVLTAVGDDLDAIEIYNPDGTLNKSINIDLNPRAGVAVIGDIVYTIGPDHLPTNTKNWCHGFDLNTGARVSRWEFVNFYSANQAKIAVGTDGTNLIAAGVGGSPVTLYVFKYNPATGAQVGSQMTDAGWNISARELFGVHQIGSDLYITHKGSTRVYTVSGSTITRKSGSSNGTSWAGWSNPNNNTGGMTFVGDRPVLADSSSIYAGSSFTADTTVQACFTWTNGSQETTPSPIVVGSVFPRESVTISLPKREGLQKNLYLKSSQYGGNWAKTTIPVNTTSVVLDEVLAGLSGLPTQNTFPASTPAVLKSGVGNLELRGDGSGRIGPLTFGADGSMTGIPKMAHGKIAVSVPANTTTSAAVTLPAGMFTTVPDVVVTAGSSSPFTSVQGVSVNNITTTSFDVFIRRSNADTTGIHWIAMGE